ncbi:MAG: flagellar basal body-associated FliL family protein [Magnetococcales bacterium]|nr:flagellar basal body-associated FliL family protein [Magnetococcales bacterium]
MPFFSIIGLMLICLPIGVIISVGGDPILFVHFPSLLIVVAGSLFLGIASFGWLRFTDGIRALGILFVTGIPEWATLDAIVVIRTLKWHLFAAGFLGSIIGTIRMLANMSDPSVLGHTMALNLLPIVYGSFLALFVCQPALNRLLAMVPQIQNREVSEVKRGSNKVGVALLFLTLLLLSATVFMNWSGFTIPSKPDEPSSTTGESDKKDSNILVGEMFRLKPMVVNLMDATEGREIYLHVVVSLEVEYGKHKNVRDELERRQDQIRDLIGSLLSAQSGSVLRTPEGKFRLREEILQRINPLLVNGSLQRVFFPEFVIHTTSKPIDDRISSMQSNHEASP